LTLAFTKDLVQIEKVGSLLVNYLQDLTSIRQMSFLYIYVQ
jgi:hypothetical protein